MSGRQRARKLTFGIAGRRQRRRRRIRALVAWRGNEIAGIARLAADPDNVRAEFALTVRSDLNRRGLRSALLDELITYARRRGLKAVGQVLPDDAAMLALCENAGLTRSFGAGSDIVVRLPLGPKGR